MGVAFIVCRKTDCGKHVYDVNRCDTIRAKQYGDEKGPKDTSEKEQAPYAMGPRKCFIFMLISWSVRMGFDQGSLNPIKGNY